MADRGDTHYHVPALNAWFAISSVLLLVSAFWMVIDDWSREWKDYQRDFRKMEVEIADQKLASEELQAAVAEAERIGGELAAAEEALASRRDEIDEAEERLYQLKGEQFALTEAEKKAKQNFSWERFLKEEGHGSQEKLDSTEEIWLEADKEKERIDVEVVEQEKLVAALVANVTELTKQQKSALKEVELLRRKRDAIDPPDFPTKLANVIRDFPGIDFIGPNLKVRKVVLDDLTFELNFTKKPRIDMCMTCHMSIELEGYEGDIEEPFRSHPRLDLYLTAKSPHPMNSVGCTICHRGSGESLHFTRTDHRPTDDVEGDEWYDEYHWKKQKYWDYPMLSSEYVEASCVQCHKTSMELIADDAPKVTEGYRLFERYGCYSCHKVEWFPTKRRPGPSLKKIPQKTSPEFIASWIADPKGFRPSTWMPQLFHLENYAPDETVVVSEYGAGREIKGQEWNDTAVAAISAFVWANAEKEPAEPIPVAGDAERGREVFRLSGCLACHNMAPYPGAEAESSDLALRNRDTNEHGPNLRGIATKVTPEWLFHWIKDPRAYWSETRMPELGLDDQDIADVVAYMFDDPEGYFSQVPEGWSAVAAPYDREVLEEQARWQFGLLTRKQLRQNFDGVWKDDQVLLAEVGKKFITSQGCHSCHELDGLENEMPIGTELTAWGSKTVDKLDWGFIPELFAEERGWDHHKTEQFKKYREGWIEQKLHEPRSYDRSKIKNPNEKLKMPWFDFEQEEIEAIATFVVGLVYDEVERADMDPTAGEAQMDHGLRVIRQKNCAACHVIEPGQVTFKDEDGAEHTVEGQILPLDEYELTAPPIEGFQDYLADYEAYYREEEDDPEFRLEELYIRLLRTEPGLGLDVGENAFVEGDAIYEVHGKNAWGGDFVPLVVDYYRGEDDVEDADGERRPYVDEPWDKVRWTFAPPYLVDEGYKLQTDWFHQFLLDPVPLRQQMRTKMPRFNWAEGEAGAVADYFAEAAMRDWPTRYTRKLLNATGKTTDEMAAEMVGMAIQGASAAELQGIVEGNAASIAAGMAKVLDYVRRSEEVAETAASPAFAYQLQDAVDPAYEGIEQRTPTHQKALLEADPKFFDTMRVLLTVEGGPACVQCHFLNDAPPTNLSPIAWAPDLYHTRERLRPDWVREWLSDPLKIYPGTAMPANFPMGQDVFQELLPKPSHEQIEDVLSWLFNLDRDPNR